MDLVNRGALLYGAQDLRIEEVEMPALGPHDVLVQPSVVGICGSDVHFYERGGIGPFVVRQPVVMGHEPFGVVVARGAEAAKHPLGTRVALEPQRPCGRCAQCRRGHCNLCPDVKFFGCPPGQHGRGPTHGALASYVAIDEDFAHPVPDVLDDEAGALIEPFAAALYAVRRAKVTAGSEVLISGAGPIGLLALQAARLCGATYVVVTDLRDGALDVAAQLGASRVVNVGRTRMDEIGISPDVFLECSGDPAAMATGMLLLRARGRAVLVGVGPEDAVLPVGHIRRHELTVTATFRYSGVFPEAIVLAASKRVDLHALITDRYTLDAVPAAFAAALSRRQGKIADHVSIKAIVDLRDSR